MTSEPLQVIESVLINGNLASLPPSDRVVYYNRVCESLGLNPLTQPFAYITLNGKLTLYARKDATDQLRRLYNVSIIIVSREQSEMVYTVTARATMPDGRTDEEVGSVPIGGLKGEALSNAIMKAHTKAKRRVTLSIVGLGWLDETEVESIPDAKPMLVDSATGEVIEAPAKTCPTHGTPLEWSKTRQQWDCRSCFEQKRAKADAASVAQEGA